MATKEQSQETPVHKPWDTSKIYLAVDAIVRRGGEILLIERKNEPHGWALPGGFVDLGESVEEAVVREVFEETGLTLTGAKQFHVYSRPGRDPRGIQVASVVFYGEAKGEPAGGDDAKNAQFFSLKDFPRRLPELAFDHAQIIDDWYKSVSLVGGAIL